MVNLVVVMVSALYLPYFTRKLPMRYVTGLYMLFLPCSTYLGGYLVNICSVLFLLVFYIGSSARRGQRLFYLDRAAWVQSVFLLTFIPSLMVGAIEAPLLDTVICWIRYALCLIFYLIVLNTFDDEVKICHYLRILMGVIWICAICAVIEMIFFPYQGYEGWRLRGPFREYELFSEFLVIMFPLVLYQTSKQRMYLSGLILSLIIMTLLVGTGTRGGPVALVAGTLIWILVDKSTIFKKVNKGIQFLLLLGIGGALGLFIFINFTNVAKSHTNLLTRFVETDISGRTMDTREIVWGAHLAKLEDVFWFGKGPAHVGQWLLPQYLLKQDYNAVPDPSISFPHNLYMALLELGGVSSLVCFLTLVGVFYYQLFHLRKNLRQLPQFKEQYDFINVLIVVLSIFMIDEIKIEFVRYDHYMLFIYGGIFGLIGTTIRVYRTLLTRGFA